MEIDRWKSMLSKMGNRDKHCEKILRVMDAEDERLRFSTLEDSLGHQDQQIRELLEASRIQDERLLVELQEGMEKQKEYRQEQVQLQIILEHSKYLEALRTTEYQLQRNDVQDRLLGTCEWVLGNSKYRSWLNGQASAWLWVTADPGCYNPVPKAIEATRSWASLLELTVNLPEIAIS